MTTTTRSDWPQQLMLPGQAAAPAGPVDTKMMYVMHHAFRRDLRRFAAAAAVTPAEDRDAWAAMAERWEMFSHVLHRHHSGEDAGLWPWLLRHATADERITLEAMEAEHARIDPVLTGCAGGFARMAAAADDDTRSRLAVLLADARDGLGAHLEHEETGAMALVQKYMTSADWKHVEETYFAKKEPLRAVAKLVPWVAHELPADVRRAAFAEVGLPFLVLWMVTRRRFERLEARAFRHAPSV